MKKYKVWVHIEEIDEEEDHYEDIGEPMSVAEFDTLNEAIYLRLAIVNDESNINLATMGGHRVWQKGEIRND